MNLERQPKFSLNSDVKRIFKIATTSDVELLFLDKLISRIQEQNLNVGVEVVFHLDEEEVKRALRLRQVDFIVTLTKIEELSFLNTKLAEERIVVAASENHPRLQGEMTEDDFFSEKHYVWNVGENGEKKNRDTYAAREVIGMNLGDREVVYKGSVLNLLFLTAETENICILSEKLFDKATKRMTGLQKIKFPFETKSFPIYAISHKSYENDEGALWLRNEIQDILSHI